MYLDYSQSFLKPIKEKLKVEKKQGSQNPANSKDLKRSKTIDFKLDSLDLDYSEDIMEEGHPQIDWRITKK